MEQGLAADLVQDEAAAGQLAELTASGAAQLAGRARAFVHANTFVHASTCIWWVGIRQKGPSQRFQASPPVRTCLEACAALATAALRSSCAQE